MRKSKITSLAIAGLICTFFMGFTSDNIISGQIEKGEIIYEMSESVSGSISGPNLLESGETGTWTISNSSNPPAPPSYAKWYYKEGSGFTGTYTYTGVFNHTLQWNFENPGSEITVFVLKAVVKDMLGNTIGTYYRYITVWPEDCPNQIMCM